MAAKRKKKAKKKVTKRKAAKRKTTKRKATKRKAAKSKATKRKGTKRRVAKKKKATKRKATKRKAKKKKAAKRKVTKKKKPAKKPAKKKAKKKVKAKTKRKPNPAFMRPLQLDAALSAVVGSTLMPRTEVTKQLWVYIRKNGLQDSVDRRMINADDKLKVVFNGKAQVSMFEMTKLVSRHMQ